MAVKITILSVITVGQGDMLVNGELAFSGNYPAGGDILDFTQATADPDFQGVLPFIVSAMPPKQMDIWSMGGNLAEQYWPVLGALLTNCKVKITTDIGTEVTAGTYAANAPGVLTDDVTFSLLCAKL